MTSFSSLISSLGDKQKAPAAVSTNGSQPTQAARKPDGAADRFKLTPSNAAAGVKRRSEEPEAGPKAKQVKKEQNGIPSRPIAAPSGRFQLTAKSSPARTLSPAGARTANSSSTSANPARAVPKQPPRQGATGTPTPPGTSDGSAKPKKGFASILEKAKAAQAAATASSSGGIKHKPLEKLTRKERLRLQEEAKAAQKAGRRLPPGERSRSGTPAGPGATKKAVPTPETAYKGTMKKPAPEPLGYKGTMKPGGGVSSKSAVAKKGQPQDKYGGYASWSDLDDAEDEEEEDGYGYDDSDEDMEAGLDDLEAEETAALRAARREDQEALEEEDRLRREKAERKRRLLALSKSAAAKKKF